MNDSFWCKPSPAPWSPHPYHSTAGMISMYYKRRHVKVAFTIGVYMREKLRTWQVFTSGSRMPQQPQSGAEGLRRFLESFWFSVHIGSLKKLGSGVIKGWSVSAAV